MKIVKANELAIPRTMKMMLYGQPGMGKTTLALSAPKPLLLDFDKGVQRVKRAHLEGVDIVQIDSWRDVEELLDPLQTDLSPYETIVVDTVGKMLDYIITRVCGMRNPRIQDWSDINQKFKGFERQMGQLGKNIIYIAHRDTRKIQDSEMFVPSLRESNYKDIIANIDLLGYVEMETNKDQNLRTITFDPTSYNEGKNTCGLPSKMVIPSLGDGKANDFLTTKVINPYFERISAEYTQFDRTKNALAETENATTVTEVNALIEQYANAGADVKRAIFNHGIALGFEFDKTAKQFVEKQPDSSQDGENNNQQFEEE